LPAIITPDTPPAAAIRATAVIGVAVTVTVIGRRKRAADDGSGRETADDSAGAPAAVPAAAVAAGPMFPTLV
jgi:hypothetical protein